LSPDYGIHQKCLATRKLHPARESQPKEKQSNQSQTSGYVSLSETVISPGRKLDLNSAKPSQKFKADSVLDHLMSDSDEENNNLDDDEFDQDFLGENVGCLKDSQNQNRKLTQSSDYARFVLF
jgi:hypothetical protein